MTDPRGSKFNYFDYLHQVARAVDLLEFDGLRIPDDPDGDEPWIVAGYVGRYTHRLKLVTEFEASRGSAVYAAKNAVSFQRFTGERFAWQIRAGEDETRRRGQGDAVAHRDQLARIEEFVTLARGVISNENYDFKGRFFEVLNGGFRGPLAGHRVPEVYLSGSGDAALRLSARIADVHVFDAAPVEPLARAIERLRALAAESQRAVRVGLQLSVLAREDSAEAIRDARRHGGHAEEDAVLVGSYSDVAERLLAYENHGVHAFLLSGAPHFEEAYRFGENVLPLVRGPKTAQDLRVA